MHDNEVCAIYFISISFFVSLLAVVFVRMILRVGEEDSRLHEWVSSVMLYLRNISSHITCIQILNKVYSVLFSFLFSVRCKEIPLN